MSGVTDIVLRAGAAALTVSPANGGRIASLRLGPDGTGGPGGGPDGVFEVVGRGGPGVVGWGCYAMAPFAGRIRRGVLVHDGRRHQLPLAMPPHAIHGVTIDRAWDVVDRADDRVVLRCAFDSRWPWPGHAVQEVRLAPDGSGLDARIEVHSERDAFPAWTGFHPWFARRLRDGGEPVEIDLPAEGMLRRDEDGMPTDEVVAVPEGPWDDVFTGVTWPVTLTWPGTLRLRLTSDAPYAVVFTEREAAVCVEPQSSPPNAAELGRAATVTPDAPLVLSMAWDWEPSRPAR